MGMYVTNEINMVQFSHQNIFVLRILSIEQDIVPDKRMGVVTQVHRSDTKFSYTICVYILTTDHLLLHTK